LEKLKISRQVWKDIQNKKVKQRTKQNKQQQKQKNTSRRSGVFFCLWYNFIMSEVKENKIKRVGILRGGVWKHYASSLQKGGEIISCIFENLGDKYKTFDILVDKDYTWHLNGVPILPADLIHKVDVVWNTSHPNFSNILDSLYIPNISTGSFSYALENGNDFLRKHVESIGVQMPRSIVLPVYQKDFDGPRELYATKKAREVFEKFSAPWIVKSFTDDSNMGVHLVKTFPELVEAIEDGVQHEKSILIEEFIAGKVASVHSVPNFRGEKIYTFPLGNSFGVFSVEEKEKLTALVKYLHKHIGAKHYLKSDFILTPRGKIYLLQVDGTPDLKPGSHFSEVCESVGAKMHHVVEHILEQV
jgi:D-alanine-D-alanine ligase-like ATP-grasp enzyme